MKFTHGEAYNFNISAIQNKSVISIVMRGIHSYVYDYRNQKYLCDNHNFC